MELFVAKIKVTPLPKHPYFFDWQFALLELLLLADDENDACSRSMAILAQLPYEMVDREITVSLGRNLKPKFENLGNDARRIGLAMRLMAYETGADESVFENIEIP